MTGGTNSFGVFKNILEFLPPQSLWFVFAIILFLFFAISGVLLYHWVTFTHKRERILFLSGIYFVVSALLIGIIALSLSLYLNSL